MIGKKEIEENIDTPETNMLSKIRMVKGLPCEIVSAEDCRKMERERNEAIDALIKYELKSEYNWILRKVIDHIVAHYLDINDDSHFEIMDKGDNLDKELYRHDRGGNGVLVGKFIRILPTVEDAKKHAEELLKIEES